MPWKNGEFQWDREEAYADQLQGRYGHEHDERLADLVNLENGIRKYWADKLRAFVDSAEGTAYDATGIITAADFLDPYEDTEDPAFARTDLDDGDADGAVGSRRVKPV